MPVDINAIDFSGTDIGQEAPAGPDFSGTGLEDVDFSGTELEQELPERSALRAAGDLGASFGVGANMLLETAGNLYGLASGDMENWATMQGESGREFWQDLKSERLVAKEQARQARIDQANGEWSKAGVAFWDTVSDPDLLTSFLFEQVPMMLPIAGVGRVGAAGAKALGGGAKAAARVGAGAGMGTAAAMQGSDAGSQAYDQLMALPDELWKEHPAYQALLADKVDPEVAKHTVAMELSRDAAIVSGLVSLGTMALLPGGAYIESRLGGGKAAANATGSFWKRLGKNTVGEALQEGAEEAAGAASANYFTRLVNPAQSVTEGTGQSFGLGAAMGGPISAVGTTAEAGIERLTNRRQPESDDDVAIDLDDTLDDDLPMLEDYERQAPDPNVTETPLAPGEAIDPATGEILKADEVSDIQAAQPISQALEQGQTIDLTGEQDASVGYPSEELPPLEAYAGDPESLQDGPQAPPVPSPQQSLELNAPESPAEVVPGEQDAEPAQDLGAPEIPGAEPVSQDNATAPPQEAGMPLERVEQEQRSDIDAAAQEAATSPTNDRPEPTEAQIEAGNYKKGHIEVGASGKPGGARSAGLKVTIENPRGSVRSGKDRDGNEWSVEMRDHYGYIKRTEGADGDHVDVFVGPHEKSRAVFVIDQIDQETGQFDEHKVMLGFHSRDEAVAAYLANYTDGWKVGPVSPMGFRSFQQWLKDGDTSKPFNPDLRAQAEQTAQNAPASDAPATREDLEAAVARLQSLRALLDTKDPALSKRMIGEVETLLEGMQGSLDASEGLGQLPPAATIARKLSKLERTAAGWRTREEAAAMQAEIAARQAEKEERLQIEGDMAKPFKQLGDIPGIYPDERHWSRLEDRDIDWSPAIEKAESARQALNEIGVYDSEQSHKANGKNVTSMGSIAGTIQRLAMDIDGYIRGDKRSDPMNRLSRIVSNSKELGVDATGILSNEDMARAAKFLGRPSMEPESGQMTLDSQLEAGAQEQVRVGVEKLEQNASGVRPAALGTEQAPEAGEALGAPEEHDGARVFVQEREEHGPGKASPDAISYVQSSPDGTTALEISVRPSGKRWHQLYLSLGNGQFVQKSIGSKLPESISQLVPELRQKEEQRRLREDASNAKLAEEKKKERAIAAKHGFIEGAELGVIVPNTGKQLRGARIVKDHGDGTFDVEGTAGAKRARITKLSATRIARAVERYKAESSNPDESREDQQESGSLESFGEKLGGSRADRAQWQMAQAIAEMDDKEIASQPLSKLWPKDSLDKIEDKFVAAFATAARAEIPAKPRKSYKLHGWVEKVKVLAGAVAALEGKSELHDPNVMRDRLLDLLDKARGLDGFKSKVQLMMEVDREHWGRIKTFRYYPNSYRFEYDAETDQRNKVLHPHAVLRTVDGGHSEYDGAEWRDHLPAIRKLLGKDSQKPARATRLKFHVRGTVKRGYHLYKDGDTEYREVAGPFETPEEAFTYREEQHDKLADAWEQIKAKDNVSRKELRRKENRPRTGQDWRKGKDVTPEQFQESFGFRGTEFGNWVTQGKGARDRQGMLNQAFDALMDLAAILDVPSRAMSLEGQLGIAFGSRGHGWASAHFEPGNLVINLTKTRGAGALAHEWFHALDNYFQRKRGIGKSREGMYITYRPEPLMRHKSKDRMMPLTRGELSRRFQRAQEAGRTSEASAYDPQNWEPDPSHPEGVRPEVEVAFADLVEKLRESPMIKRAEAIDKGKADGYWSRIIEVAARSFESYIIYKMGLEGFENDFLANVVSWDGWQNAGKNDERYPYIRSDEIAPIEQAFDRLFRVIEARQEAENVVLYSKSAILAAESSPTGMPVQRVESETQNFLARYIGASAGLHVRVHRTQEEAFGPDSRREVGRIKAGFTPSENTLHIVAEHVEDRSDLLATLRHEIFVHKGLGFLSPRQQRELFEVIAREAPNSSSLAPLWASVQKNYANEPWQVQAEELLALVAEGRYSSFDRAWGKILNFIRRLLAKFGLIKESIERSDLMQVVYAMGDAFREGRVAKQRREDQFLQAVYHGTPHEWEGHQPSLERVGTGEGAQAFGWGLYFAGHRGVAEYYRDEITQKHERFEVQISNALRSAGLIEGVKDNAHLGYVVVEILQRHEDGQTLLEAAQNFYGDSKQLLNQQPDSAIYLSQVAEAEKILRLINDGFALREPSGGRLYEAEIPEDSDLLDWDLVVPEQPQRVRQAIDQLEEYFNSEFPDVLDDYLDRLGREWVELTGSEVYKIVERAGLDDILPTLDVEYQRALRTDERASLYLGSLGVPGLRYRDQFSRGVADVTGVTYDGVKDQLAARWEDQNAKAFIAWAIRQDGGYLQHGYSRNAQIGHVIGYARRQFPDITLEQEDQLFDVMESYDPSKVHVKRGTHNYVIWDEAVIDVQAVNDQAVERQRKTLFSARSEVADLFRRALQKVVRDGDRPAKALELGDTPAVLRAVGAVDGPLTIPARVVHKATSGKHSVPLSVVEQLPELMADPALVMRSASRPGDSMVVFVSAEDSAGDPVVVAVRVGQRDSDRKLVVNSIRSIYGKENVGVVRSWVRQGLTLYYHTKKSLELPRLNGLKLPTRRGEVQGQVSQELPRRAGVQFPGRDGRAPDSVERVLTERDIVKKPPKTLFSKTSRPAKQSKPKEKPKTRQQRDEEYRQRMDNYTDAQRAVLAAALEADGAKSSRSMREWIREHLSDKGAAYYSTTLALVPRQYFPDFAPQGVTSVAAYVHDANSMDARRNELQGKHAEFARRWEKWAKKNPVMQRKLADLMHQATIAGVDPAEDYKPLITPEEAAQQLRVQDQRMRDAPGSAKQPMLAKKRQIKMKLSQENKRKAAAPALQRKWDALPEEAKAIYIQARDDYTAQRALIFKALEDRIERSEAEEGPKGDLMALLRLEFESQMVEGPYFPLKLLICTEN